MANSFSFFTILTNLLVAVGLTLTLMTPQSRLGRLFLRPVAASATAVYIAIVGVTYALLLRSMWSPQGAQKIAAVLLHDLVPVLYVAYWLIFVPKGSLRWKDSLPWSLCWRWRSIDGGGGAIEHLATGGCNEFVAMFGPAFGCDV